MDFDPLECADDVLAAADWNLFGLWFGAVATFLGAIGTVTAVFVALSNSKQAQKTAEAVRRDALTFRQEETEQKLREQADQICAWVHDARLDWVALLNSSDQPVFNLMVYSVWAQGAAWQTGEVAERQFAQDAPRARISAIRSVLQVVPPGKFRLHQGFSGQSIMQGRPGVEVTFTDMTGHHWVRRVSGELQKLETDPFKHYNVGPAIPEFSPLVGWEDETR